MITASRSPPAALAHAARSLLECVLVQMEDAAALVADVLLVLGARGRDVRVTAENQVRLVRLGALMLAEFETRPGTEEDGDG